MAQADIIKQIRALLDQLDGGDGSASRLKTPVPTANPPLDQPTAIGDGLGPDATIAEDFYMVGRIAAMKGAKALHYREARSAFAIIGYDVGIPYHYSVIVPGTGAWIECLMSVGDIGWKDGDKYQYDAAKSAWDNRQAWISAGCPHYNSYGQYGNNGVPVEVDRKAWDDWARRFRGGKVS